MDIRKLLLSISGIFLVITIGIVIYDCVTHNYVALLPMYTHNLPHGLISWSIFLTLVPFGVSRMFHQPYTSNKKIKH